MKIWIDEKTPAPDGYRWCKHVDDAIIVMQDTSMAIDRAIRNNQVKSPYNQNGVDIRAMRPVEINVSAELASSRACNVLRMFLEESGQTDNCPIVAR